MNLRPISSFTDAEYRQQAANANFSKIPNLMGFKPTANKVLNTLMIKKITTWQKVEVISNLTALEMLYLGGSSNIDGVTVNTGTTYTGSNNVSVIETKGDWGARLNNSAAASRYIFGRLGSNFHQYFNPVDLKVLPRYNFEGKDIEYQFLTFNIPMLIVNGAQGLGSGHACKILPRSEEEITKYLKYNLEGKNKQNRPFKNKPHYNGFNGTVEEGENHKQWIMKGIIKRISKTKIEIVEVPIGEGYKSYIKKLDKLEEAGTIKGYDDLCDPKADTFSFIVRVDTKFSKFTDEEILKKLKLVNTESENYTYNDEHNRIVVADNINEIFWHYYKIKIFYLEKRKEYLLAKIAEDIRLDISRYTFIKMIVEDELLINKRTKAAIVKDLNKVENIIKRDDSYDYLLSMAIGSLTKERMKALMDKIKANKKELDLAKKQTIEQMWLEDLK